MGSPLPEDQAWSQPDLVRSAPGTLARLTGSLDSLIADGVARRERRRLIVLLMRADEASRGGTATISMPVDVACPDCRDGDQPVACSRCGGARTVSEVFTAWLTIPPGVTDGAILAAPIELPDAIAVMRFRVVIESARDPLRST